MHRTDALKKVTTGCKGQQEGKYSFEGVSDVGDVNTAFTWTQIIGTKAQSD